MEAHDDIGTAKPPKGYEGTRNIVDKKIPKSFSLYGQTINVVFDNQECAKENATGLADYDKNLIILADKDPGNNKLPDDAIQHVFWHEVLHHILHKSGYKKLAYDECLIQRISGLIHQALTTMKYLDEL